MPRQADEPQAPSTGQDDARQPVSSRELLGGRRELQIVHNGSIYRLRVTGNGKLILTK
ncbi:hemin uptake protein HemP [Benzoatithermus flavus]|uniref:Hemin uptake protein HemP n=1 Tax=Benzoatithermus flavus TaxID=3108223 RepID=A0ABU8XTV2_9PROT